MRTSERLAQRALEAAGLRILTAGWPDFLAVQPDGAVRGIEVKSMAAKGYLVSTGQRALFEVLEGAGMPVRIALVCGPTNDQVRIFDWRDFPVRGR